jgi:hypothetical protein
MVGEERDYLTSQLRNSLNPLNSIATAVCAAICIVLFSLTVAGQLDPRLFGPLLSLSIVFVAIVPLQWTQQLQSYRETLGDIQIGEVEIFRTTAASASAANLVYLPRSCRLLSENGRFAKRKIYLHVNGLAIRPRELLRPFPHQFTLEQNRVSPVRTLSHQEKQELASLLPADHRWKWLIPALLWSWTLIGSAYLFEFGFSLQMVARVVLVLTAALSLTTYYGCRAKRLDTVKKDLRRGTVVCEQMGSYTFEHLIKSELLWTVDSRPASWRKRSVSSWVCPTI